MQEKKIIRLKCKDKTEEQKQIDILTELLPNIEVDMIKLFTVNTQDLSLFYDIINKFDIKMYIKGYKLECTQSELKKSNYLKLGLGIFGKEDWTDEYDTEYDTVICPVCKSKKSRIQKSQLSIDKSQFGNKDISTTSNSEIIISERLKNLFEENDISGVHYEPVKHKNNRLKNDFPVYQMFIDNILPPLDDSMTYYYDKSSYCENCRATGIHPTTYLRYTKDNLEYAQDFNYTKEWFYYNLSGEVIISQKVYRILRENKIRGCRFEIVKEI